MILGFYCSDCVNETLFLCFLLSTKIEMDTIHPDSFLLVDVMGIIFGRWQATAAAQPADGVDAEKPAEAGCKL